MPRAPSPGPAPGLRQQLGQENRSQCSERYQQETCYRKYLELYRHVLGS